MSRIRLSAKQAQAWKYLDNEHVTEVFAGGGAGCFLANTLVNTSTGSKPIEQIEVGESVLSFCDITHNTVSKKVVKTFNHAPPPYGWKCVHLKLNNGSEIKCTESHEFYIGGNWVKIGSVARGIVEARGWHKRNILHQQHGQTSKHELERFWATGYNETRERRKGVLQNHVEVRGQIQDHQSPQNSCSTLDCKRGGQSASESYKLRPSRQPSGELGVGNRVREYFTQLCCGSNTKAYMHEFRKRQQDRYVKANRGASGGDSGKVQVEGTHAKNIRGGIRGSSGYHKRRYSEKLEAREIDPNDIASIEFFTHFGSVYDLHVEDTHAYTICGDAFIVHNSGKSWLGCLRQIYRRTTFADTRGFIGRRDFTALRDSTMKTYFDLLKTMGYESGAHYRYNAQEHIVYFENGSEQHFRHMSYQPSDPDYNRFGSTEYTDAFIDEAPEVDQRAAEIVLSRLRLNHARHGITPELLLTGNPSESWVKYRYVMDNEGKYIDLPIHRARVLYTIADNPDEELRKSYTKTLELLDDYDRARLLYGDWTAKPNIERPFAIQLDTSKHFRPCGFDPTKPLFISFDFNIDPFAIVYSHIWQDVEGWHFHVFDEETITGGTIDEGCDRIRQKVGNAVLSATITGDRNGTARSMTHRDHTTAYQLIRRQLLLSDRQFDLPPNPTHVNSREDCNYLLRHFDDFRVDARAVNLRRDLRTVEVGPDGKILKENRAKDAQRADHLDAWRYLVNCKTLTSWRKFHNSRPR